MSAWPVVRTDKIAPPGFYVLDEMAAYLEWSIVSGPFADFKTAERNRLEYNIADDAAVYEIRPLR